MWDEEVDKKKILELLSQALILAKAEKMNDAYNIESIRNTLVDAIAETVVEKPLEDDYMDSYCEGYD